MDYGRYFSYNAESGNLHWILRPREDFKCNRSHCLHKRVAGKDASQRVCRKNGARLAVYINAPSFGGKDTVAHRIIWKMAYGSIPEGYHIDHINGDPWDNRLSNLRLVTRSQNMQNSARHSGIGHGVKGVSWDNKNKRWQADIRTGSGRIFLGRHPTKGAAAVAYAKASLRYHGKYSIFARKFAVQESEPT